MKHLNLLFIFALCLFFQSLSFAQSETEVKEHFSYSYGVLLGENFQQIGLSFDQISFKDLKKGINAYESIENSKKAEKDAQDLINKTLTEINPNNTGNNLSKIKLSKEALSNFIYNYGLLISSNLKGFGINRTDFSIDFVENGVTDVLKKAELKVSSTEAKEVINSRFKAVQEKKATDKLEANKVFFEENRSKPNVQSLESGIQYEVLTKGKGLKATTATNVTTHYHGTLTDGTVFDSSVDRNEPISFALNGVIKGWQEIIPQMKIGSKWRVFIPPHLGYGPRTTGKIPANSILVFEIELISID